jgi:hypothetical protein
MYWWCGNDTDVTCSKTSGAVLDITPGVAIKLLTSSSSSTVSSSPTSTSAPTTTANTAQHTTSSAAIESCDKSKGNVAAVGAGARTSLAALSLTILILFVNERRRRKRIERAAEMEKPMRRRDHYAAENTPSPSHKAPL